MSAREINLIRKAYCHKRGISDVTSVTFAFTRANRDTGNQIFLVSRPNQVPEIYEHLRLDVTPYSLQRSLWLTKEMQKDREAMLNKNSMATWINKQMNLELLPDDIGVLSIGPKGVSVVIGPNSMRFKNSFIIYFL